ncbi:BnaC02g22740D [Brassica napus]|uniref:BnaC02g22740D protein n=1 Tax=Brassica napus TaxID=3708 RepID=A0A078HYM5_BRANA|nr:BnaC02g22740D [Brassica napus]
MIAAVPSLKEEVIPPEPVPVQAPGLVNNNALAKFVVIPGHARNNDGDGKVMKVSNIIDAPMEEWLSDTDFTSPDEIEDAEVVSMMKLIDEGFSFRNSMFTRGVTHQDLARMKNKKQKEKDHNAAESGEAESPDNNSNIPFSTIVGDQLKDHLGGIELRLRQAMVSEIQGLEVKVRDAVMESVRNMQADIIKSLSFKPADHTTPCQHNFQSRGRTAAPPRPLLHCINKERMALLDLKNFMVSISGGWDPEFVLPTWTNDTTSDCCRWKGIECNRTSRRVTEISVVEGIYGESSLLNLSLLHPFEEVRSLYLFESRFNGLFDDVEGYKSLRRLKNLEILDFTSNEFNNSIFPFLNAATSLTTLFLRDNKMVGPFPAIGECFPICKLYRGYIAQNLMMVSLIDQFNILLFRKNLSLFVIRTCLATLSELKDLTNLELLDLSSNKFNGSLPVQDLSSLRKMKALDLSGNEFSGSLELQGKFAQNLKCICELKDLRELDLSKNKLIGQFPICLTSLSGLRVLDLSSNQLTGKLPSALGSFASLEYLSLFDNNFEGVFSFDILANLSKLKVVKLYSKSKSLKVVSDGSWKPRFQLSVIVLGSCNLENVPHFLLHQKDLRQVDLSGNNISGDFPKWLLENNTKLELPKSAHNLIFLDVSVNNFNHRVPENIGWILPRLRYMKLANNGFEGNIPPSLGNMKMIELLDISHNSFHGTLPKSFVNGCYSLKILKLSYNKLSGEIFREPANFTDIMVLSMDNNLFTGKIGQGLQNLTDLDTLNMSNNNLTGTIPSWIAGIPYLFALLVSDNLLDGEIPISLFNMSNLGLLDLSANNLSGNIPPYVSSLYGAEFFLHDNHLSGAIPDTLLGNVIILDLRNNWLSGNIPEFVNTQNITILLLRGNNLTGHIPHQLCGLRKIHLLDLANNRLNGLIPSCLSNISFTGKENTLYDYDYETDLFQDSTTTNNIGIYFKSLLVLDPFSIDFTAGAQTKIEFATKHRYDAYMSGNLMHMVGLDLSGNELIGEIPVELGVLLALRVLNLSHNYLSGVLPESFSGMKSVESLDFSFNRLQGQIPQELTELSNLAVFNVSYNNLSGIIPQGKQFNTFDTRSYLGNPLLCGKPTNRSCEGNKFQDQPECDVKEDQSPIDMESFYWSFAAAYVTILVGLFVSLSFDSPWSRFWFYKVDTFVHRVLE